MENNWSAEFDDKFVTHNRNAKGWEWWKVPLAGEDEIASPFEVRAFIAEKIQEAVTAREEELRGKIERMRLKDREYEDEADEMHNMGYNAALYLVLSLLANKPLQERE